MKYLFASLFALALFAAPALGQSQAAIDKAVATVQPAGSPQVETDLASVSRGLVDKYGRVVLNAVDGSLKNYNTTNAYVLTFAFPSTPVANVTITWPTTAVSSTVEVLSVQAEAATDTITAGQLYGGTITNTGAVGAAVYSLPAPVVGMHFRVYLTVAQDVDVNPATGTQILALTDATGDAISSAATIGNCIELIALSATTWGAFAVSGTWTDVN